MFSKSNGTISVFHFRWRRSCFASYSEAFFKHSSTSKHFIFILKERGSQLTSLWAHPRGGMEADYAGPSTSGLQALRGRREGPANGILVCSNCHFAQWLFQKWGRKVLLKLLHCLPCENSDFEGRERQLQWSHGSRGGVRQVEEEGAVGEEEAELRGKVKREIGLESLVPTRDPGPPPPPIHTHHLDFC